YDGERFHTLATRGLSPALAEVFREPFAPSPGSFHERVARGELLVHGDHLENPSLQTGSPQTRGVVELGAARTGLTIALRKDDRLVGSFWFYRQEVRPFSDKHIALLKNFAAQAVIAIDNARLITETREALEQQTATAEVLQVINASPGDLAPVFEAMLDKAHRLGGIDFGALWTFDGEHFRMVAKHGLPPAFREFLEQYVPDRQQAEPTAFGRLLRGERLVHVPDLSAVDYAASELGRAGVELGGVRTLL